MSYGFRLAKCDIDGEPVPSWLLFWPGCGDRPIVIPQGNLADMVADFVRQGGVVPAPEDVAEPREKQRGLFDG